MKIPQNVSIFPQPLPSPTRGHWQSLGMELRKPGRMGRSSGALQPPQTLGSTLAHPGQGSLPLKTSPQRAAMQPGRRGGSWTPGSLCNPLTSSVPQFPFPTATLTAASLGQGPVQRFCRTDGEGFPMMGHPTPMPDLSSSPKTRVPCEHLLETAPKIPLIPSAGWAAGRAGFQAVAARQHQSPFSKNPPSAPALPPVLQSQHWYKLIHSKRELAE